MIINNAYLSGLRQGFTSLYNSAFDAYTPNWNRVAMAVPSSTRSQDYGWLGKTTRFKEWLGDRVIQNLKTHNYNIVNKTFENTVAVAREDIEDDAIGIYNPMMTQLGQDAAMHPDELVFDLLKAGFDTPCYDGQNFFDTDHPVTDENGEEQSVSNTGGGNGAPWFLLDTSKAIKPLILQKRREYKFTAKDNLDDDNVFERNEFVYGVDARLNVGFGLWQMAYGSKQALTAASFKAGRTSMETLKGDNGRPIKVMPNLLVVGPTNRDAAEEIVKKARTDGGDTNTLLNSVEILVVPELG